MEGQYVVMLGPVLGIIYYRYYICRSPYRHVVFNAVSCKGVRSGQEIKITPVPCYSQ